jgi:hypothetical protein
MGKVLGGGSSINVMVWARGHQTRVDNSEPAHNICFRGTVGLMPPITRSNRSK